MTTPAQRFRRWPNRFGAMLRPLLVVLLLIPLGVLFVQSWQGIDEQRAFTIGERQGIEYLRSLEQVAIALVDVQSAAVADRTVPREALSRAVENTTSVDARLGAELRTRERWAGIRARLEALPERGLGTPDQTFASYNEAGDLLLALYGKVRETSGLIRDPEADSYHLQDSVAEELPEAIVATGRLADVAVLSAAIGSTGPPADQIRAATQLAAARSAMLEPVADMVDGLQAAVRSTENGRLSGNLLSQLEEYQRTVETLAASTNVTADAPRVDPARVAAARTSVLVASVRLSQAMLTELDALLEIRLDNLDDERLIVVAAMTVALLIVFGLTTSLIVTERRRADPDTNQTVREPEPVEGRTVTPAGLTNRRRGWDRPVEWSEPVPVESGTGRAGASRLDAAGSGARDSPLGGRDGEPAQWGRADVAR